MLFANRIEPDSYLVPRFSPSERVAFSREFGLRLQRLRVAAGLSQEYVAHQAGLAVYTYRKFEKGESKPGTAANPGLYTLLELADVFKISLGELLPLADKD